MIPAQDAASSLYAPLPKAPTAQALTVRSLIGKVRDGAVRVPLFQRPLRWRADDVVKLFDSMLRGYPIGSLLFWKHTFPAGTIPVGNAALAVPAVTDGWYIVDGQQRVTALAASLLDLDQGVDPRWQIRFDVSLNAFFSGSASAEDVRRHVPLRTLGDLRRLGRWFPECELSEDEKTRVEEVQQRLLDYEVPGYVLDTDDIDALKGVFARTNSTGVRMRADEVFQALLGQTSDTRVRQPSVDLGALQRAADLDGFGEPPRTEVLKALLAMSGLDPSKRLEDFDEFSVSKIVDESSATDAIERAVAFLQASFDAAEPGAGIPANAFLPYPVVFVILARFFHLFPGPDPTTRRALARWLWKGVMTGVHQRAAVSAMRHQVKVIDGDDMGGSIERLLDATGEPPTHEWVLDPFHASHAASRVEILALLELGPRSLDGPVSWRALLSSGDRVAREVFRVAGAADPGLRGKLRTAANRVLLDTRHSDLKTELRRWTWAHSREALESHLIDEQTLADLARDDSKSFVERRGSRLRAITSSFIARRAGLGEPRVLPVSSYYDIAGRDARE